MSRFWRIQFAFVVLALLVGCGSESNPPAPAPAVVDLDAQIAQDARARVPILIFIFDGQRDKSIDFPVKARGPGKTIMTSLLISVDISVSRNRATATRYHVTSTPLLLCLTPGGVIVSRDEGIVSNDLMYIRTREATEKSPEIDGKLTSLKNSVAMNPTDVPAQLQLADFLLSFHNDREAIPHLEFVAHSSAVETDLRIRTWVKLVRAHLWIFEPEKGRHEAHDLIETLSSKSPEARAGGLLVLGLQDANAKRVTLARQEFDEAIAAAPASSYAKEATEARDKLPEGK